MADESAETQAAETETTEAKTAEMETATAQTAAEVETAFGYYQDVLLAKSDPEE